MAGRTGSSGGLVPPPGYRLVREEVPSPPNRDLLLAAIQAAPPFQRLVVEAQRSVTFFRYVKADEADLDEIVEEDLFVQARSNEMLEFTAEDRNGIAPSTLTIFSALKELRAKGLQPLAFLFFDPVEVGAWLFKGGVDVSDIFGVRGIRHGEVPEGVLLLLGANPGDTDVVLTLRISLQEGGAK